MGQTSVFMCWLGRSRWKAFLEAWWGLHFSSFWALKGQMFIIFHFCGILRNVFLHFSYYCEWFPCIAPQATLVQGTEGQAKKMVREVTSEDSAALYIREFRGRPEAELEINLCSQHASQCRNSQKTQIPSLWLLISRKLGKKNCRRDLIKVKSNESLQQKDFIETFDLKQWIH